MSKYRGISYQCPCGFVVLEDEKACINCHRLRPDQTKVQKDRGRWVKLEDPK